MAEQDRIRSIAVLGGGIVGLSAAAAFARSMPGTTIQIIETAPDPAAFADRMPGTLPSIRNFHRMLGIKEQDLVRNAGATHRIGIRFGEWSADGQPWFHTLGLREPQIKASPFYLQWLRAREKGRALPYHLYTPAGPLAEAQKFFHPHRDPDSALSMFDYTLRLDPLPYRQGLAALARQAGVRTQRGELAGIERREDGGVAAITLVGGQRIEADMFLDCAGPTAPLLSALDRAFEDWSEFLPCDRLLLGEAPPEALSSVDIAAAMDWGWRWAATLPSRTLIGAAFASGLTSEERAREDLTAGTRLQSPELVTIRPGRRPAGWVRNVIAFGDAAVAVDPLEWTNLHLAQSAITRALSLLPGRDFHPLVLEEYNRRTGYETARVRDFLSLHYLRSERREGEFWQSMPGRTAPDSLAHTLVHFEERGRMPHHEEETFSDQSWISVLIGLGIRPRRTAGIAAAVDLEEAIAKMEEVASVTLPLPASLPSYGDYLAEIKTMLR